MDPERRCGNSEFALTVFYALCWIAGIGLIAVVVIWALAMP